MFEKNKKLQNAIDKLYSILKDEEYGNTYSWNKLALLSGMPNTNKQDIYYIANKVCLLLMKHDQKYLITEHGSGKRIVIPSEHNLIAKKTANKSVKIYRKAGAVIASTNLDKLNDEEKNEIIQAANKYSTLEMFTNEMLKKKKIGQSSKEDVKTASLFLDTIKMFADKK